MLQGVLGQGGEDEGFVLGEEVGEGGGGMGLEEVLSGLDGEGVIGG